MTYRANCMDTAMTAGRMSLRTTSLAILVAMCASGCATTKDLQRLDTDTRGLVSSVEVDLAKAKGELAVASLKYQNANEAEKAAMRGEVAQLQQKVAGLEAVAAEAREAMRIATGASVDLAEHKARQKDAIQDALLKFEKAESDYKHYQQPKY